MAATTAPSCMSTDHGCVMFDCLVHLWEWIDPPEPQSHYPMENKKSVPATQQPLTQQHLMAHHVHPDQIYSQHQMSTHLTSPQLGQSSIPPNGVMHQLLQSQYHSNMDARSPLLENRHELYNTGLSQDYPKHYGANDNFNNYPQSPPTKLERNEIQTDHNVNHELLQNIPKGYNAEVYQDYLKRNPPKDTNQIYQNHQPMYRPNSNQYSSKPYLPFSSRVGPQSNPEILRRQYNEIQQMKLQQQMHYQNQAQMYQQQKFAERQLLLQHIHGIQPPPNLQNSIYSDGSYRDLDRYGSKNDFKEYSSPDIQKDLDRYIKNNEFKEIEKQNRHIQEPQWQPTDFREIERYRNAENDKNKSQTSNSESNNQKNNGGFASPMKSSESSSPSIKSPSTESRRSSGGTQALRSPIAQRSPSAPVTMSGILYKQGSDGLKAWKKRWFVLSEYCLFYYKSQDEEKLLGSVLLPSYNVSACSSDDKKLRKFAFKLEHANMRTYILAAPDQEAMMKWVKGLTMAALMQSPNEQPQKMSERTAAKTEDGDEVPGPTYANAPPKPRRSNEGYNSPSSDIYDPNYDLLKKPASHYSQGTSHTRQQEHTNYPISPNQEETYIRSPQTPQNQPQYQTKRQYDSHNLSLPLTNTVTDRLNQPSTSSAYRTQPQSPYFDQRSSHQQTTENNMKLEQIYDRQPQLNPFLDMNMQNEKVGKENDMQSSNRMAHDRTMSTYESCSELRSSKTNIADMNAYNRDVYGELNSRPSRSGSSLNERLLIERRTPDAYGRSTTMSSYNTGKGGDYEDVYSAYLNENEYGQTYAKSTNPPKSRDAISVSSNQHYQEQTVNVPQEKTFTGPAVLRRKKMQSSGVQPTVPRPHSADFLEYESRNGMLNKTLPSRTVCEPPRQPQRPKSSLDINSFYDPSSDRYYSEESYAEKMRQSAQYLQPGLGHKNIKIPLAKYASGLAEKQLQSPYSQTTNNNYETELGMNRIARDASYNSKLELEALDSNWTLKEKEIENQKEFANRSASVMSDTSNISAFTKDINRIEQGPDGFCRSLSARLPSNSNEKEGERKVQQREESMKRLLEWKQRMLQSPLTRKSTPATISLARSLNQSRQSLRSDQYKSKVYTNASYNSYSSDDEEETSSNDLQKPREIQAGRSQRVKLNNPTLSRPIASHAVPIEAKISQLKNLECGHIPKNSDDVTYENILNSKTADSSTKVQDENNYVNTLNESFTESLPEVKDDVDQNVLEINDSETESESQIEYTDNDLDEVLLVSDDENKIIETKDQSVSELKEPTSEENQISHSQTPPVLSGEDHYLPMSPRKTSTIEPAHKTIIEHLSVFNESMPHGHEDNPYVEMTIGLSEDASQTYEIVCVNNGKVEPVYMELSNLCSSELNNDQVLCEQSHEDSASNFADTKDHTLKRVPKIDKQSKESVSGTSSIVNNSDVNDCSDADSETPKDLTLQEPYSRFSISDTFRPASYYLAGSKMSLNRQDSSDSEILSPPPIPNSTPPYDDLSDDALSKYILDKLDRSDIAQDNSILKMLTCENQKMNTIKRKTTSLMIYGSRTSIHDTLSRGEKVRNSRASLTNERNMLSEMQTSLLNNSIPEHYNSGSIETDSLQSYNADQGSSRLSLESDVSSKFDIHPSNISSEVASLNESESGIELRNPQGYSDLEVMMKRRPLSDDSIFNLVSPDVVPHTELAVTVDLDRYLDNLNSTTNASSSNTSCSNSHLNTIGTDLKSNVIQATHIRCSSTPVSQNIKSRIDMQMSNSIKKLAIDQTSGYTGSQSSCSSLSMPKSPLSYYSKNDCEEKHHSKNLNNDIFADKIKEFENEKLASRTGIETNASSSSTGFHSRDSSTEHSAPYYYSDLSSQEQINVLPTSHFLKNTNIHRKLNNQRRRGLRDIKKNEISHIHNPIHNNDMIVSEQSFDLSACARSVSVEFLSAADKDPEIDLKNIYESTRGKTSKIPESLSLSGFGCKRNSNSSNNIDPFSPESIVSRTLNNCSAIKLSSTSMSSHCSENSSNTVYYDAEAEVSAYENIMCQGEKHWDEDALWRDNLRRVSHRHARSMDDLDAMPSESIADRSIMYASGMHSIKRVKKSVPKKVSRNVTYVNCDIQGNVFKRSDNSNMNRRLVDSKIDDNDVYVSLAENAEVALEPTDEGVYEQLSVNSPENSMESTTTEINKKILMERKKRRFEIDREKLRQWDLMSSGLMKGYVRGVRGVGAGMGVVDPLCSTDSGADSANNEASMTMSGNNIDPGSNVSNQQTLSKKAFLGSNTSIGRSNRDANIPVRAVSPRVRWVEDKNDRYGSQQMSASHQNLNTLTEDSWATVRSPSRASQQPISAVSPRIRRNTDNDDFRRDQQQLLQEHSELLTAGELLGRTHEELVLLLIQLRRRHAATHRAIEHCCAQISSIEENLSSLKAMEREESYKRLEQMKMQLMDLENQYEKSKPLVTLVDNMVKLGSLYNRPSSTVERLERNQRLRQKVLAEHASEQQRWLESAAAGRPLETEAARARVAELWALEQELADEASILQGLRSDKDTIENLLTGVRSKLDTVPRGDLMVRQPMQNINGNELEAELARVHAMLALNSKKLEQTVADNGRLERELSQLRRALHARRAAPHATHTAGLEHEVTRVQQLVTALQRQRQELSRAVRHLTQQSHALQTTHDTNPGKRRPMSSWSETNLDTGATMDHVNDYSDYGMAVNQAGYETNHLESPLYVDTRPSAPDAMSPNEDYQNGFGNLSNVEKQEIKTVRIVKRESERRQRDRDRSLQPMTDWPSNNITANLDQFLEEELMQSINYQRSSSVPRTDFNKFEEYYSNPQTNEPPNYLRLNEKVSSMELSPKYPSSPSLSNYDYSKDISSLSSSYHKSYDRSGYDRTISVSTQYLNSPTDSSRTLTNDPLSKTSSIGSLNRSHMELSPIFKSEAAKQIITEMSGDVPKNGSLHRRQVPKEKRRHNTAPHHLSAKTLNEMPKDIYNQDKLCRSVDDADMELALRAPPDVVRSALAPASLATTAIDQLLFAPQKILIPERYIPEKPPELSPEEQAKRQEKVESIKKMLTSSSAEQGKSPDDGEKKQREHLLQMNQILAKQVTEMSKIIAVKALEELPLRDDMDYDDERSPDVELPIYQQRDNFFT